MPIPSENMVPEPKPLFAGIDVGAEELVLVIRNSGTPHKPQKTEKMLTFEQSIYGRDPRLRGFFINSPPLSGVGMPEHTPHRRPTRGDTGPPRPPR